MRCAYLCRVEILGAVGGRHHVDDLIVAIITELDGVPAIARHHFVPLLPRNICQTRTNHYNLLTATTLDAMTLTGTRVHDTPVADDETVLGTRLPELEVGVLDLHHGPEQVLLEVVS